MTKTTHNIRSNTNLAFLTNVECTILENEKYGEHSRNIFDIILPKSENPTALVIFLHGGGFYHGDKEDGFRYPNDIINYIDSNIAFATANYRYYKNNDSLGIKACINDAATLLQHIRFNSDKYNITKELIGCYGSSAGAGISLYLAFKEDLAIENSCSQNGESTKIKCAGALATQATYNLFRWKEFIPGLNFIYLLGCRKFRNTTAHLYGYESYKKLKPYKDEVAESLDMLNMITPNSPPIYIMNMQKERFIRNKDIIEHHPEHAIILSKYLTKNNVEHKMYIYNKKTKTKNRPDYSIDKFMIDKLTQ